MYRAPKRPAKRSRSGVPGATTSRAIRSASMTGTPSAANRLATVDLPLAMPPVRPTRYVRCPVEEGATASQLTRSPMPLEPRPEEPEIVRHELVAPHQHEPSGGRQ